ncbi:hypothetical protein L2E82_26717 [Cichorium intybus]|uniref:Uncharacterized protein n=1 Tax=Cichorium intybus TaxID=13427 RepID=A0ACB9CQX8_CICIN|nr:hypothetical protein L2E82_26717 [Cichorium intybus]
MYLIQYKIRRVGEYVIKNDIHCPSTLSSNQKESHLRLNCSSPSPSIFSTSSIITISIFIPKENKSSSKPAFFHTNS